MVSSAVAPRGIDGDEFEVLTRFETRPDLQSGRPRFAIDKEGDITHTGSLLAAAASSTSQFIFRGAISQTNDIFEVQDSITNRVMSVSATATSVTNLIVSGTCTGCGGGSTTLQQAYDNSTGTTEIFLGSTHGALTLADSLSTFGGNLFEIQDRTNGAGDYSKRYFTVSSTSTLINPAGAAGYEVGIGTSSPTAILHLRGDSITPDLHIEETGASSAAQIDLTNTARFWRISSRYWRIRI